MKLALYTHDHSKDALDVRLGWFLTRIESRYAVDLQAFDAHVSRVRAWGRAERAKLGL